MTAGRTQILVVEDEALLLMMAVEVVEDASFQATEASNADQTVALFESNPDITILWTMIPERLRLWDVRFDLPLRRQAASIRLVRQTCR